MRAVKSKVAYVQYSLCKFATSFALEPAYGRVQLWQQFPYNLAPSSDVAQFLSLALLDCFSAGIHAFLTCGFLSREGGQSRLQAVMPAP